jgi:uncharacterized protein YlxW (UPF0749 family)
LKTSSKGGTKLKKIISQIIVGGVCTLLGFMLTYQFKLLSAEEQEFKSGNKYTNTIEITSEIEQLKKQKAEIEKKNNELLSQLKKYETAATDQSELTKEIKKQLDDSRILLGITEVQGPGVIVYLTPKNAAFTSGTVGFYATDEELFYIMNELNFAGAEAVSINDKRITSQSGIKSSSNNSTIKINNEDISAKERIVIKAIGDKVKLDSALNFPGALDFKNLDAYEIKIEKSDSITIPKYTKTYKSEYIKPVNK